MASLGLTTGVLMLPLLSHAAETVEAELPMLSKLVIVSGPEPSMRWRSFCTEILGWADRLGVGTLVTLGALPDVGSSLILTWNVPTQETQQPATTLKASQSLVLNPPTGLAVQPGSLSVTWEFNGTKTATAATSGELSGAASGSLSESRAASLTDTFSPMSNSTFWSAAILGVTAARNAPPDEAVNSAAPTGAISATAALKSRE